MKIIRRIYVEKKKPYAIKSKELYSEIKSYLGIETVEDVRELIRYDIENISDETYKKSITTIFSEPPVDLVYEEELPCLTEDEKVFGVEYLPGQFDQRADSAQQCVRLLNSDEDPVIRTANIYIVKGNLSTEELSKIKEFCINPVDSMEATLVKPDTLMLDYIEPEDVEVLEGFILLDNTELTTLYNELNLAMTLEDFKHIYNYYSTEEKRNPTMTEIKVLDTYWSDHCRHTTFLTEIKNVKFEDGYYKAPIINSYNRYINDREALLGDRSDKYPCLMDMALLAMRKLRAEGKLQDLEESEEINACSIVVPVEINGKTEEWIVSFKNETHNHPTEIEPFGGAATCLGGAIRDPLSGRSYVYQAMRVTGSGDPTVRLEDTMKGKLPQRKITTGAALGYSSYGNQIGLATGHVKEVYHPNYVAKRLEIGAVIGAAPRKNIVRETSDPGDLIILLGGRTGRDGCGGATGSSKVHTEESINLCGAEVQKGNAPTERKIQRLFRNPNVSRLIKKCNDFGAGGVAVAIGELADGLHIHLDKVPKKYEGLNGTELAISESQERMAVVVDSNDAVKFLKYAAEENLEATIVAEVTEEPRLVMIWKGKKIVDLSRRFLDTNGAHQVVDIEVQLPEEKDNYFEQIKEVKDVKNEWLSTLRDLNVCSQKGLVEQFDSSIGAASVTMPYGGKYQLSETQYMASKLPILNGESDTTTLMTYGFDPYLSSWSPYHGSVYAVIHSVAKIVAAGANYKGIRFTFQEYFKRLNLDPKRWSEPFTALLGAYEAQMELELPSIGGKDSMSGSFNDLDVPPTLVSFAVQTEKYNNIITPELKGVGNKLVLFSIDTDEYNLPDYIQLKNVYDNIYELSREKVIKAAYAIGYGGICEAVSKMAFGNKLGVNLNTNLSSEQLFRSEYGGILVEIEHKNISKLENIDYTVVGEITNTGKFIYNNVVIDIEVAIKNWKGALEEVFPTKTEEENKKINTSLFEKKSIFTSKNKIAKPKVFIPVFPGTNCEYDSLRAFRDAGADVEVKVFKNINSDDIKESINMFEQSIRQSQIIMFPGGFSAGDEPDGSGKFIAATFRNERLKNAIEELLYTRDGLALGICNGFQALIKLGLLPYGEVRDQKEGSPTLTTNNIGRHISKMVYTKVVSNNSPWFNNCKVGDVFVTPVSHGEGRFVANDAWIQRLFDNGQVATQYVDFDGIPTMNEEFNPNGSYYAIEGITSPDGRILGKMAHSERKGNGVAINIQGNQDMKIFEAGVNYFK